jgi:hypothetical protein
MIAEIASLRHERSSRMTGNGGKMNGSLGTDVDMDRVVVVCP